MLNLTLSNIILLIGGILIVSGIMASKLGSRIGVPALLVFLLTGMFFGSSGLGLDFNDTGRTQFLGTVALAVILFFGGFETKLSEIRPILAPGLVLSTVGVALTTALFGGFLYWLGTFSVFTIHLPLIIALLLAATMSSTDSASVFALLRSSNLHLRERLSPILELESGSNDPMAYMLTIALIQFATGGSDSGDWSSIALTFFLQFSIGIALGYGLGRLTTYFLNHMNVDNAALYPITLLCIIFFSYSITDILGGNGYLAVYIMGVMIGNHKLVHKRTVTTFFDGVTWLLQIILFITLGLYVDAKQLLPVIPFALLAGMFMIFVARPIAVHLCMLPFSNLSMKARHFLSWVGLRGAVPIIFATYPLMNQVEGADTLFSIVFVITLLSLLIQGSTIPWMARLLGIGEEAKQETSLFGVEIPQHTGAQMEERTVTADMLSDGNKLMQMDFREGELVILVRRGEEYKVPRGKMELKAGDSLLIVSEQEEPANQEQLANLVKERCAQSKKHDQPTNE